MSEERSADDETRPAKRAPQEAEPLGTGCAVRLMWLIAGPFAVAFSAAVLARHERSDLLMVSAIFWGTVGAMIAFRFWDVTRLGGQTTNGEPATLATFKRYSLTVTMTAAALFGVALLIRG